MENLPFPTHFITGKYKTFNHIKLSFLSSQGGIWFLSIRVRRGPSWRVFRCLLSRTDARLSVFPVWAQRKPGCLRRGIHCDQNCTELPCTEAGTGHWVSSVWSPLQGYEEAPLCTESTGGSRDISSKKGKESLFHPRHQRAPSWWVTGKALKSTIVAIFSAACEGSEPRDGVRCVWGGLPQHLLWALRVGTLGSLTGSWRNWALLQYWQVQLPGNCQNKKKEKARRQMSLMLRGSAE